MQFGRSFHLTFLLLVLLLCGAEQALNWLRRGNESFRREDYRAALERYAQAIPLSTDPGQVAFQQAAAHARLEEDAQAAVAYLRCLEDAKGVRRVLALYGRGNALAQEGNRQKGKQA